ncbi:carbonic anhydrase [[Leptolyngbya] sp. PCC 7376]|uniref:carbonic anhydrase n=1 Tax=[Leptolyngbya] sp. PCC 7376 TaxID=111781 RepID=UPI00029F3285|nr:carbonic anhydrase [[Leptolyngbya] sp. PCC 7376]AFY37687.1 carbonic anhydrase [[Leptolyngbya] sp. PCC 7376]
MNDKSNSVGRRDILKIGSIGAISLAATAGNIFSRPKRAEAAGLSAIAPDILSPDTALQALLEGNQRFVNHQLKYPDQTQARMKEVAQGQKPFATVLSCADSRVLPEILFDQGIGDIFDVRIAGNIATPEALGSIEYAVELLESPILMVLGHERCGAVTAAVQNEPLPGDIGTFVEAILPALKSIKGKSADAVNKAVVENVRYQIEQLQRSPLLTARLESEQLKIVGARYDLDTGLVTLIT